MSGVVCATVACHALLAMLSSALNANDAVLAFSGANLVVMWEDSAVAGCFRDEEGRRRYPGLTVPLGPVRLFQSGSDERMECWVAEDSP